MEDQDGKIANPVTDTGPTNKTTSIPPAAGLTPFVTVAICTRNRSRFLEKAIRSVMPQLTVDSELLIVDNASTDETPDMANRFASINARIRVCLERELGLSVARNRALSTARGEFV